MATQNNRSNNGAGNLVSWKKGQSGNPGGRPKMDPDAREMLKAAAPGAIALLIETANDPDVDRKLRVDCANRIIERVYGKTPQPLVAEVIKHSDDTQLSLKEMLEIALDVTAGG